MTGGTGGMVAWRWVTPEYFKALDIPVVRGHNFTEAQRTSSDHFMILSSRLASRLFPGQDPMGQRVKPVPGGPWFTVQGVAANVKNSGLSEADEPEYYQLWRSEAEDWQQPHSAALVVKTTVAPAAMASWIRSQISAIDSTVPVDIETLKRTRQRPCRSSAVRDGAAHLLRVHRTRYGDHRALRRGHVHGGAAHAGDRNTHGSRRHAR